MWLPVSQPAQRCLLVSRCVCFDEKVFIRWGNLFKLIQETWNWFLEGINILGIYPCGTTDSIIQTSTKWYHCVMLRHRPIECFLAFIAVVNFMYFVCGFLVSAPAVQTAMQSIPILFRSKLRCSRIFRRHNKFGNDALANHQRNNREWCTNFRGDYFPAST